MGDPITQTKAARVKNALFQAAVITAVSFVVNVGISRWNLDDRTAKYREALKSDLEVGLMAFSEAAVSYEKGNLRPLAASDAKQLPTGFELSLHDDAPSETPAKTHEVTFATMERLERFVDFYNRSLEIKTKNGSPVHTGDAKEN